MLQVSHCGADGESRTRTGLRPPPPQSGVSTISPHPLSVWDCKDTSDLFNCKFFLNKCRFFEHSYVQIIQDLPVDGVSQASSNISSGISRGEIRAPSDGRQDQSRRIHLPLFPESGRKSCLLPIFLFPGCRSARSLSLYGCTGPNGETCPDSFRQGADGRSCRDCP